MNLKKPLVSALLFLAILSAGARTGSAQEVQPLEPEWLRQMYAEGWHKVQEGVLQRETEEGGPETFSYGTEGLQWVAQRYKQQVADLKSQYAASPSEDLADLIDQLEDQILRLEEIIDSAPSAESFDGDVLEACSITLGTNYGGTSSAGPQTGTPGVTATASAYFHNECGYVGDTSATASATATSSGVTTSTMQIDPKTGTSINSYASVSVNGSNACEAWAQGSVTVTALSIYYLTPYATTSKCKPDVVPPPPSVPGISNRPAATLLLPYFEVELDSPNGINTLFSINNSVASAQLARVTIWSTWSVPVLAFDVYLTGFDAQTFNIYDLLVSGVLPQTGSGVSPKGPYSAPNGSFPNCNSSASPTGAPVYPIPALGTTLKTHLRASLTGKPSTVFGGKCAGRDYEDTIARGYITVDDVNSCSLLFPSDPGYFVSGGLGVASNDNVLWGDYRYINPAENYSSGETLVHIRADAATFKTPGEYTFYGRYVGGSAADNRQPLPTSFATKYMASGGFTGGTELIVWRDSKFPPAAVTCGNGPNYVNLSGQKIMSFDESENSLTVTGGSSGTKCIFCDETQRVPVNGGAVVGADLLTNAPFGWLYLNLNHATTNDAALGSGYVGIAQAWVTTVMDSSGRFSIGYDAIQLDNANQMANPSGRMTPP